MNAHKLFSGFTGIAVLGSLILISPAVAVGDFGGGSGSGIVFGEFSGGDNFPGHVPGEIVVKFKSDNKPFHVLRLPAGKSVAQAVAEYSARADVEFAEPNYIAQAYFVPDDTYYSFQWHMDNASHGGIHTEAAWDVTRGASATVAIVDTGIAYENYNSGKSYFLAPDLAGTCFVGGYDFVNNDAHANDDNSHGTHVAGTVAQSTNNSLGTAGVAHESCLMPVKVLDRNGSGSYANVAAGIRFAADNGADVINLSLGGPTPGQVIEDAVAYAYGKGVVVVAASGNDNGAVGYPAAYDDYVIAVGATRYDEARAPYSNFGPSLDIVAPGGDTSVDQNGDGYADGVLQNTFNPNNKKTNDFGYWFFQGTSMATPHVAGVAALVIANGNATTPDEVRSALQSTADDLGATGRDDFYGWGLVNASAALGWVAGPVDNSPTVTVTNPANASFVAGAITITADASDDNGVTKVEFYAGGALLGEDMASPYEWTWDSTTVSDGEIVLTATAYDTLSQTASASISVTVDNVNDAPVADAGSDQTVTDSDSNGSESVTFDGSGSFDPDGFIVLYEWREGATLIASGSSSFATVDLSLGAHTITLTVTDDDGATASDDVSVSVVEAPPIPDIALSATGYKVRGLQKADLEWSGAASTNVDVYRNGVFVTVTANGGFYTDNINQRGGGSYVYKVCEEGTATCSNESTVAF